MSGYASLTRPTHLERTPQAGANVRFFAARCIGGAVALCRLELRQPNILRGLLERDRDFHAELHVFHRTLHDIRDHARAFVEVHPGDNVGDVGLEGFRSGTADDLANDGEGINFAFAAHERPFDAFAAALIARGTRRPNPGAAILAALDHELVLCGGVPERFRFRGDRRQGFSNVYFSHDLSSFISQYRHRAAAEVLPVGENSETGN